MRARRERRRQNGAWRTPSARRANDLKAWRRARLRSRSRTTSRSRPPASTSTGSTGRRSGATAGSTASSRGRELRIEAAPGGVDVSPYDESSRAAGLSTSSALPFDLEGFTAWAAGEPELHRLVEALAGFRPPLQVDPFEALVTSITAQQVSLQSAAAIRSRFIERYGIAYEHAHSFPTRERVAQATEEELFGVGFSNRKAEYVIGLARSDLDLDELASLPGRGGDGAARRAPRPRRVDGRLVPRAPPRPARTPGRRATWDCGRRSLRSMVTCPTFEPSPSASTRTRT